jgi:hypothetical protein
MYRGTTSQRFNVAALFFGLPRRNVSHVATFGNVKQRSARRNVATLQCCFFANPVATSQRRSAVFGKPRRNVATLQRCFWKTTFGTSQRCNVAVLCLENHVWHVATSQRRSVVFGKPRLSRPNVATSQCCVWKTTFGDTKQLY